MKYLPKRESTHANVQSCPYNEKRELKKMTIEPFCFQPEGVIMYSSGLMNYPLFTARIQFVFMSLIS